MKTTIATIGAVALFIAIVLGFAFGGFELRRYFAPKYEGVRYDVHKESQSYRDGMVRRLRNLQIEYEKASPEHKQVIASTILHESADFPSERMPADLRQFINSL